VTDSLPVIKGNVDGLVLKALDEAPMHGFEIANWLADRSAGTLEITASALYQSLYRLEARSLVSADWGVTENNRRARYYEIRPAGRRHLAKETRRWLQYARAVSGILGGGGSAKDATA
jgi:PadR family transcriptional regulator